MDAIAQVDILVHEMTHCVQYEKAGAAVVMARRSRDAVLMGDDAYTPSAELTKIKDLRTLNVVERRFAIESVATYVETTLQVRYTPMEPRIKW